MSNVPALPSDYETGLEDFGMEDAVIPRLSIVHKEGQFKDSLSNEQFDSITVIILGLVKQRVLWHTEVDDGDWPMCRSTNHSTGLPNLSDDQPKAKRFPWSASKFDPADYPPDEDGVIRLPCEGCALKEWGSHPDGKRPYCSEQFTLPVLYDPRGDEGWLPAILTFQKTGLKPLKAYLSSFARNRNAAFMAVTQIGLDMQKRGQTDYSVPNFKRIGDTDEENWREYSITYRTMRDFLEAEPGSRDEGEDKTPVTPKSDEKPPADSKEDADEDIHDAEIVEDKKEEPSKASSKEEEEELPF